MKKRVLIAIAILFAASAIAAADDVQVRLSAEDRVVQVGDSIDVQIAVEGMGMRSPDPQLTVPPNLTLEGRSSGTSMSIVNGRMSASKTMTLTFRAVKAGKARLGPATVTAAGRKFQSDALDIEVVDSAQAAPKPAGEAPSPSQAGQSAFIDTEVTATTAYPGQEIGVSYFLYVRGRIMQAEPVQEPTFPGAIPHRLAGGGKLNFMNTTVGGVDYLVSPIVRYVIYPVAPGDLVIDGYQLGVVVDDAQGRKSRDPFFDNFMFQRGARKNLVGPSKKIVVKPLPREGQPPNFKGNVGVYTLGATADKTHVKAGEAVTLQVLVEGKGNTEALAPPDIALPEGLKSFNQTSRDESVASFDTMKSRRVFETIIVPEKEGSYSLGPVAMDVFNPDKAEYQKLTAPAIEIIVEPGNGAGSQPVVVGKEAIAMAGKDIRTIKGDVQMLESVSAHKERTAILWLVFILAPLAFVARVLRVRRNEHLASNVALARRIKAGKEARKRLAEARKAADGPAPKFGAELYTALMNFVADQLVVEAPSLTAATAKDGLASRGIGEEELAELTRILAAVDAMRYAGQDPSRAERDELVERAGGFIDRVHRALAKANGK